MNRIILHGRLARGPELKTVAGGIETCHFTVAVNRPVGKDKDPITDFIPCTAWRQTAAFIAKYFRQGDGIILEGVLNVRKYEHNGEKRTAFEVNADRVEFAEKKGSKDTETDPATGFDVATDDQLPF